MGRTAIEVDIHVGRRIRHRRESLGISQGRLARHLGLTFSQVQKYEKGVNRIGAGRLYMVADLLGVPVEYFFEGLDQPEPVERSALRPNGLESDLSELTGAFVGIRDHDTRRSVIALVRSLAAPAVGGDRPIRATR